jgi:hypothetical protein
MNGKVCLGRKGKILLGYVNKLLDLKLSRQKFEFFPVGEGDGIKSRLCSSIFSTLPLVPKGGSELKKSPPQHLI